MAPPRDIPRVQSQQLRLDRMVDVIAKLTRRQSRAMRAQVGYPDVSVGEGGPLPLRRLPAEAGVSWGSSFLGSFL